MKVSIYVPVVGENANRDWTETTERALCDLFGGCTRVAAEGSWVSPDGRLVGARIDIVYSYAQPGAVPAALPELRALCAELATELGQQCVLLVCGETPIMVAPVERELPEAAE